jgi:hypothetical protein
VSSIKWIILKNNNEMSGKGGKRFYKNAKICAKRWPLFSLKFAALNKLEEKGQNII